MLSSISSEKSQHCTASGRSRSKQNYQDTRTYKTRVHPVHAMVLHTLHGCTPNSKDKNYDLSRKTEYQEDRQHLRQGN